MAGMAGDRHEELSPKLLVPSTCTAFLLPSWQYHKLRAVAAFHRHSKRTNDNGTDTERSTFTPMSTCINSGVSYARRAERASGVMSTLDAALLPKDGVAPVPTPNIDDPAPVTSPSKAQTDAVCSRMGDADGNGTQPHRGRASDSSFDRACNAGNPRRPITGLVPGARERANVSRHWPVAEANMLQVAESIRENSSPACSVRTFCSV